MKKHLLVVPVSILLAGCASKPADPALLAAANRQITCTQGPDCEAKWSRAVQWILSNSTWKIQVQTDQMIQTFGPADHSPESAFVVTKAALSQGTYEINFRSACDNIFGCIPSPLELRSSFVSAVIGSATQNAAPPPASSPAPPQNPGGKVTLGIQFIDVPPSLAASTGRQNKGGAMIVTVAPGSVADKAGLLAGDVITMYNSTAINSLSDLRTAASLSTPGSRLPVHVFRGAQEIDLFVSF